MALELAAAAAAPALSVFVVQRSFDPRTAVLAACFMLTSITLAILAAHTGEEESVLDKASKQTKKPAAPNTGQPVVPLSK